MADLIRGRWSKRYVNSWGDKRAYDDAQREHFAVRASYARRYVEEHGLPDISDAEREEIRSFWGRYGFRVVDFSWWRMYYAVTGLHDPRFVPDDVMGLVVYAYYNDPAYADAWRDKNEFERLLPGMPFPEAIGRCRRGRLVCGEKVFDRASQAGEFCEAAFAALGGADHIIVKDARHSGHGRGVRKYAVRSASDILTVLGDWGGSDNFVMQRCIRQHPVMAGLNQSSVNIYRVVTWRHGGDADVLFAAVRYGAPGSVTDDSYDSDGNEETHILAVTPDGRFAGLAIDQDGMPTGEIAAGEGAAPGYSEMCALARRYALALDNFDLVGWDFAVDEDGSPVCLEYNIEWPGTVFYQFSNGPYAGERTEDMLAFLLDEDAQHNWIPWYMASWASWADDEG